MFKQRISKWLEKSYWEIQEDNVFRLVHITFLSNSSADKEGSNNIFNVQFTVLDPIFSQSVSFFQIAHKPFYLRLSELHSKALSKATGKY